MTREASFVGCSETVSHTPQELADAGFFYAGFGDCVRCFYCGIGLRHWMEEDNPWIEHARWSHSCVYVKQKKGEDFVNLVQQAIQYSQDSEAQAYTTAGNQLHSEGIERILVSDAAQRVLEIGYPPKLIKKAIEEIFTQNSNAKITAQNLLEKLFEIEEAENRPDTAPAPAQAPATSAAPQTAKPAPLKSKPEADKSTEGAQASGSKSQKKGRKKDKGAVEAKAHGNGVPGHSSTETVIKKREVNTGNNTTNIEYAETVNIHVDGSSSDLINGILKGCETVIPNGSNSGKDIGGKNTDMDDQNADGKASTDSRPAGQELAKKDDDTMTQIVVHNLSENMKSVGALIFKGVVAGTVFRAGDDYVITAFHVIRNIIDRNQTGQYDFSLLEGEDVFINFNASVCQAACFLYRVRHEFSSDDEGLDFAVLQITNPVQLPKKLFLYKYDYKRLQVKELSGIGYGHPENRFEKHLDPKCPIISSVEQKCCECEEWLQGEGRTKYYGNAVYQTGKNPDIVNKGYRGIDSLPYIFLDITMEDKGSGAPFVTSDGKVVAILTHGHPEFYYLLPKIV